MKKVITLLAVITVCGWAAEALACGITGSNAGTEGSGTNLASEYSLTGK